MNQEEIKKILPHRDDMLLIDEATEEDGISYAKKKIRPEEWFLRGHFPNQPVVPGVVLCEILAQSSCVLLKDIDGEKVTFLTGIEKARFKNKVVPHDLLETECKIVKSRSPFYWAEGKGYVEGKLCVEASFSFAVMGDN